MHHVPINIPNNVQSKQSGKALDGGEQALSSQCSPLPATSRGGGPAKTRRTRPICHLGQSLARISSSRPTLAVCPAGGTGAVSLLLSSGPAALSGINRVWRRSMGLEVANRRGSASLKSLIPLIARVCFHPLPPLAGPAWLRATVGHRRLPRTLPFSRARAHVTSPPLPPSPGS